MDSVREEVFSNSEKEVRPIRKMSASELHFNTSDWAAMKQLCEDHEKYPEPLFGKTSTHEDIMIEIHPDHIITQVFQQNGWVRKNVYHPQEVTTEELYEERWDSEKKPKRHRNIER